MDKYTLKAFLLPCGYRPALCAALSLCAVLACAQSPALVFAVLPCLGIFLALIPPFSRRASLLIILGGLLSFYMHRHISKPQSLPAEGQAQVIELLERPGGYALVALTPYGKVRWKLDGKVSPLPGDSIDWKARWFPLMPPSFPGAFDAPGWMHSQQLVASGKLESYHVRSRHFHWQRLCFVARSALRARIARALPAGEGGLLMGLLAGDRSGMSSALQEDFTRTGLVHVLAISGYHVVLLAGMLSLFLRSLRLPHNVARLLAMALLCLYAPVTGGSAAVWRAVAMFLVIESATLFQRKADPFNALGVAVTVLLLLDPSQVGAAGFQLSVAATAGILLGQHLPWHPASARRSPLRSLLHSYLVEPSWVTLCASAATLPLLVFHFQSFSPIAWLGNLVVVPLVGLGMQAGVLSLVPPDLAALLYQPFADACALLLRLAGGATSYLACVPGAALTLGPWPMPCLAASLLGLMVLPGLKQANPWGRRLALACLLLCAGFFLYGGLVQRLRGEWSVTMLDVGQGDCLLVSSPGGLHLLVDAGPPGPRQALARERLLPFLRASGIGRLHALVITHPDADHFGGADYLLRHFPIDELWTTSCARLAEKKSWESVLATASSLGMTIRDLERGYRLQEYSRLYNKNWILSVLHPGPGVCAKDVNTGSIVLGLQGPGGSALLAGDADLKAEGEFLPWIDSADLLKLGHHGSRTASGEALLKAVHPRTAWISAGAGNRFGHPHPLIMKRLDSLGIKTLGTYNLGSQQMRCSNKGCDLWHYQGGWKKIME